MTKEELTKKAKKIIRKLMVDEDVSYIDLQEKLKEKGYHYSVEALRSKVTRGAYDIRFLLQVLEALEKKIKIVETD